MGFEPGFLPGQVVAVPEPGTDEVRADVQPTKDGETVRDLTHFSLSMSASRRMCRWVAWNIGPPHVKGDSRSFHQDKAYERDQQIPSAFYVDNDLDQGHIAAFADVSWGTEDEALAARKDSCCLSNITPQLYDFNRSSAAGIWGKIENTIRDQHEVDGDRLSVFGGPVLDDDYVEYNEVLVPRDFWKVVAYTEAGTLRAKGFVVTQKNLESHLRPLLEEYAAHQRGLAELSDDLGLDFGVLVAADLAPPPRHAAVPMPVARRIDRVEDIVVPGW